MKRIILFIDSLTQGGAQRQIVGLACLLQEKGYCVHVLTYYDFPFYAPDLDTHKVSHQVIEDARKTIKRIINVRKALKRYAPDIVISYLDTPNMLACIAKMSGTRFKLIVSERNTTQRLSFKTRIKFWLFRYADAIVPNSYTQAQYVSCHYPKLAQKIHVITNFVDMHLFKKTICYKHHQILKIIGVGRMDPQKNIPQLINAVYQIRERGIMVIVDWYGRKTKYTDDYVDMVKQYKIQEIFKFHDPIHDIADKYYESDLFCLPSLYEGYPNVLCEAMACGLPVICSDVCDNGTIVENEENGFLFNPKDLSSLVSAIIRFYGLSEEKRRSMSKCSRKIAESKFASTGFVQKYISLIEK